MNRHNQLWLGISIAVIVLCAVLIMWLQAKWGIDFTGGSLLEVKTRPGLATGDLRLWLQDNFSHPATVQAVNQDQMSIKTVPLSENEHRQLIKGLREEGLASEELKFESIGPTIGQELRKKAGLAILIVMGALI